MNILIVDDDLINRKFLKAMLQDYGNIEMVEDGEIAVEMVQRGMNEGERRYEVIFLDIMMPNLDGHETLKEIRRLEGNHGIIPGKGSCVIMVSALSDKENVMVAFSEGCEYYLAKPVKQDRLYQIMEEMGYERTAPNTF